MPSLGGSGEYGGDDPTGGAGQDPSGPDSEGSRSSVVSDAEALRAIAAFEKALGTVTDESDTEYLDSWQKVLADQRNNVPGAKGYSIGGQGYNTGEMTAEDAYGYGFRDRFKINYAVLDERFSTPGWVNTVNKFAKTLGLAGMLTGNPELTGVAGLGAMATKALTGTLGLGQAMTALGMSMGLEGGTGSGTTSGADTDTGGGRTSDRPSSEAGIESLAILDTLREVFGFASSEEESAEETDYVSPYLSGRFGITEGTDIEDYVLGHMQDQEAYNSAIANLDKWRMPEDNRWY